MTSGQIEPFSGVPIGQQLGILEYMVTSESLESCREAVEYPEAAYPNIVARECLKITDQKMNLGSAESVTHCDRYFRPPVVGRRVQVTGWLREKRQRRGVEELLIETFAVDDIGTEVLRSSHVFRSRPAATPERLGRRPSTSQRVGEGEILPVVEKRVTERTIEKFEAAHRTVLGAGASASGGRTASLHTGAELASGMGLASAVAPGELGLAYLHEMLDRRFGADFRQGGRLEVSYRRPIYAGDSLAAKALARPSKRQDGRVSWQLQVWLENGRGEQVITGIAQVTVPSPLT